MTFLVPFDGSDLSVAALERAAEFAGYAGQDLVALTVIPDDPDYARERGWVRSDEPFAVERVAGRLEGQVAEVAPDADFRHEVTENTDPVATIAMDVTRAIRQAAAEVGATVLFVGSENAGRVSTPLTSVGNPISEDPQYDVFIVRHAD
ncbi:MAG: universal stress protein [Halobacteriaceae archaeon]